MACARPVTANTIVIGVLIAAASRVSAGVSAPLTLAPLC
jgi:hypothetical protein